MLSTILALLLRRWWRPSVTAPLDGTPSRMSILARVAVSNTSSTPSILSAEHSLYARAPIVCAILSPCSLLTQLPEDALPGAGRKSALHPTRITGIVGPHIERTSSIHCGRECVSLAVRNEQTGWYLTFVSTFSRESGVSRENAMRITWDFEYDIGRKR